MRSYFASAVLLCSSLLSFTVPPESANKIAEKIWMNECGGKVDGLTSWKKGENFGSFGIGHFIWYPVGKKERFEETFPELLKFLISQGVVIPAWVEKAQGCPWHSREEFYLNLKSPEMLELRQLLVETKDLQAIFIANRLEKTFPQMVECLPESERAQVTATFKRLAQTPKGLYALIDYLNFKGSGVSPAERYNQQGWGLLQVLQKIPPSSKNVVADFAAAAKELLTQRVQNSPPDRREAQWLKGWLNRVSTYLEPF
ncbi:MAG: hypothetical protein HYX48_07405 [Chlamydiales bacterium]|nr:hypothetical protein [Chlamydiales bacterium]